VALERGVAGGVPTLLKEPFALDSSFGVTRSGALRYAAVSGGAVVSVATVDLSTGAVISAPQPISEKAPDLLAGAWSPDGTALVARSRAQGRELLVIRALADGRERPLNHSFTWISQVQWPAPSDVVVRAADSKGRWGLFRVDVRTGASRPLEMSGCREERCPVDDKTVRLVHSVSPDFRSVYYAFEPQRGDRGDRVVVQHDLVSGRDREVLRGPGLYGLRLSPRGTQISYVEPGVPPKSYSLRVLDIATRTSREVVSVSDGAVLTTLIEWTPDGERLFYGQVKNGEPSAWIVPVSGGGRPVAVNIPLRDQSRSPYRSVHIHPDGRRLMLTSGPPEVAEVWTLENFLPR
jgi:Tol biopolymer transport system component